MTKIAVLTIMYEDGDERCSAYIETTQCFHLGGCLLDRVKGFLLRHINKSDHNIDSDFLSGIDDWFPKREDEVFFIGEFLIMQLNEVTIL